MSNPTSTQLKNRQLLLSLSLFRSFLSSQKQNPNFQFFSISFLNLKSTFSILTGGDRCGGGSILSGGEKSRDRFVARI
ncbi:hypothetical protein P8452_57499 [Trifolium repens]|nr:hypothetical protein P8452_57499 [Trifolium repens]